MSDLDDLEEIAAQTAVVHAQGSAAQIRQRRIWGANRRKRIRFHAAIGGGKRHPKSPSMPILQCMKEEA